MKYKFTFNPLPTTFAVLINNNQTLEKHVAPLDNWKKRSILMNPDESQKVASSFTVFSNRD